MEWILKNWATLVPIIVALLGGVGYLLKTYVFQPKKKEPVQKLEDARTQFSSEQMKSQLNPQFFTPALQKSLMELEEVKRSGKLHERLQELSGSELLIKKALMEKELEAAKLAGKLGNQRFREALEKPSIKVADAVTSLYKSPISDSTVAIGQNTINQTITNYHGVPPQKDVPPTPTALVTRMEEAKFIEIKPLPMEISAYIQMLTPFQKLQPLDVFADHNVSWRAWFDSMARFDKVVEPRLDTMITFKGYPGNTLGGVKIYCSFNIVDAPNFKLMHQGTMVGISGTIEKVNADLLAVTIKNPHFFFFD
jgi:hypothetical protein